ncbi:MAG: AI-2E family transporter [Muribaculaceae bacterium]|nr:AI-2E family transporter [Muribaculaceae bacterium]MDE5930181.1 AI-2E family transporter [Muribaculaceae bacterium]MDE6130596.1 AI-2E family transporter [Muribaculaceae bacterium]
MKANKSAKNSAARSSGTDFYSFWERPFTFDRVVRILIITALAIAAVVLVNTLRSVLLPFLVAWLIAYILEPFVQYNRRLLGVRNRILPIFVTLFESLLLLSLACIIFVPSIIEEMHQVAGLIRQYASNGSQVSFIPQEFHDFLRRNIDFRQISDSLTRQDIQSLIDMAGGFISGGLSVVLGVFNWFIVVLYVVFIMLDYEKLLRGFRHVIPPKYRKATSAIGNDVKSSMNHYFRGQALVASCVGVLFCIGFSVIGMPLAVVLGLFIGLLNMVPYLQLVSLVPTTLLCLVVSVDSGVDFWPFWWKCMLVYIIVQCIQDFFLTPRIMGKAMGLNPAIILLSLSVWGTLLGFIGLIIALPLTTLLLAYYNRYIINRNDGETPQQKRRDEAAVEDIEREF